MTVKAFPEGVVSAASLSFNISTSPSEDIFWSAVEDFHQFLPQVLKDGVSAAYVITGGSLSLRPLTAPLKMKEYVTNLISPVCFKAGAIGDSLYIGRDTLSELLRHVRDVLRPATLWCQLVLPFPGPGIPVNTAGDFNESDIRVSHGTPPDCSSRKRIALDCRQCFPDTSRSIRAPSNSVLPAWKDTAVHQMIVGPWNWTSTWDENVAIDKAMQDTVLPLLSTFSSATYLNEGNPNQRDWQEAFYGANFEKLEKIKSVWDPADVLYTQTGIGSGKFRSDDAGRLCYK